MNKSNLTDVEVKSEHQRDEESGPPPAADYGRGELQVIKIRESNSILRKLKAAEEWMDKKFGVETTGADRIPENQRHPPSILNMLFLWFSMLISPGNMTTGLLGPLFGLSVNNSIIITVFASAIGCIIPAFTATLCPPAGLRQIAVSRYAFGIWGSKFCGLLNVIVNVGFGTISCIVAGQLISAVSGGAVTIVAGIVLLCVLSFILSVFGFRVIHRYEQVAWAIILILICVNYGQSAKFFSKTPAQSSVSGLDLRGASLSYFAVIIGVTTAWCSMAGDYYVHYPANISKKLVFSLTWIGLFLPTIFVLIFGVLLGGVILTDETMSAIYDEGGFGAFILATMSPSGWSKFVCVMYALSFLANITAIYYSSSLSIQMWGKHFMAVPRFVWNILLAAISLGLAWGGREQLEAIIANFLLLLGYWTICFGTILAIEHFWFRRQLGGYDYESWQEQDRMPLGIAGCISLLLGIGASFLGMVQTWFVGPAAKQIGASGGDLGDYFALVAVCIAYPILRHFEIKLVGR